MAIIPNKENTQYKLKSEQFFTHANHPKCSSSNKSNRTWKYQPKDKKFIEFICQILYDNKKLIIELRNEYVCHKSMRMHDTHIPSDE